jgi:hypothetical protein
MMPPPNSDVPQQPSWSAPNIIINTSPPMSPSPSDTLIQYGPTGSEPFQLNQAVNTEGIDSPVQLVLPGESTTSSSPAEISPSLDVPLSPDTSATLAHPVSEGNNSLNNLVFTYPGTSNSSSVELVKTTQSATPQGDEVTVTLKFDPAQGTPTLQYFDTSTQTYRSVQGDPASGGLVIDETNGTMQIKFNQNSSPPLQQLAF